MRYWLGVFLVVRRCTYHLRLEEQASYFRRHGLFVALAARKPEKGTPALYVVRELTVGLILQVVPLLSATHQTIEQRLLQPVKALGYRMRGVVSDDEKALVLRSPRSVRAGPINPARSMACAMRLRLSCRLTKPAKRP